MPILCGGANYDQLKPICIEELLKREPAKHNKELFGKWKRRGTLTKEYLKPMLEIN